MPAEAGAKVEPPASSPVGAVVPIDGGASVAGVSVSAGFLFAAMIRLGRRWILDSRAWFCWTNDFIQ